MVGAPFAFVLALHRRAPTKERPMPPNRNLCEPPGYKGPVDAQNYNANDLVKEPIAAVLMGRHRVTLRAWRRQGRGCAYVKDAGGNILYRVGDIWEWAKANTIDPAKLKGTVENICRLSRSSNIEHLRYETGETPCAPDAFLKEADND
jgi:hypothetical protein